MLVGLGVTCQDPYSGLLVDCSTLPAGAIPVGQVKIPASVVGAPPPPPPIGATVPGTIPAWAYVGSPAGNAMPLSSPWYGANANPTQAQIDSWYAVGGPAWQAYQAYLATGGPTTIQDPTFPTQPPRLVTETFPPAPAPPVSGLVPPGAPSTPTQTAIAAGLNVEGNTLTNTPSAAQVALANTGLSGIPTWMLLAGGGLVLLMLMKK